MFKLISSILHLLKKILIIEFKNPQIKIFFFIWDIKGNECLIIKSLKKKQLEKNNT